MGRLLGAVILLQRCQPSQPSTALLTPTFPCHAAAGGGWVAATAVEEEKEAAVAEEGEKEAEVAACTARRGLVGASDRRL